jgi:hypothetical protein
MDSRTHIEFALKLMEAVGAPPPIAIASLFPQIDRHPPTLHRLYAHNVFKAKSITFIGLRFFSAGDFSLAEKQSFEYARFTAENSRLGQYAEGLPRPAGAAPLTAYPEAALLAFVSHLYLDTYNQPTQPFAPLNIYCSGQWELWKKLGDFRLRLYTTDAIHHLRRDLFGQSLWAQWENLDAAAVIQAMMARMCGFSEGKLPLSLVEEGLKALGLPKAQPEKVSSSIELLQEFEGVLNELHQAYLPALEDSPKAGPKPLLADPKR